MRKVTYLASLHHYHKRIDLEVFRKIDLRLGGNIILIFLIMFQ